jgi:gamma-glutamyltranspeptidase / glutathione hydrolase
MINKKNITLVVFCIISIFAYPLFSKSTFISADTAKSAMVAAGHPDAAKIGIQILENGGNAVDAAVAMAFAIGVVEPYASGLGGGGGMLIYLKDKNQFHYLDYYVQSPQKYDSTYSRDDGIADARAICIPGTPSGLITAVEKFGNLTLGEVLKPAIDIAEKGTVVNQVFYNAIVEKLDVIMTFPETQSIFFSQEGLPVEKGGKIDNPQLSNVLIELKNNGADYFYGGQFAKNAATTIKKYGGSVTFEDFDNYETLLKEPLSINYRGFQIFSAPPPQSGLTLLEILNILENVPQKRLREYSKNAFSTHVLTEAIKRADTDRFHYVGDPRFIDVPLNTLLNKDYARQRFDDIDLFKVKYAKNIDIPVGNPKIFEEERLKSAEEGQHTTQISVVDKKGNAVSLTQTLGLFFGSGVSSDGVLFNSSMSIFYDFDSPNCVDSGKRPLSTICPTIIMKDNQLYAVLGTPGGPNIFNTMAEVISHLIDLNSSPITAVDAPRFSPRISRKNVNFEGRFSKTVLDSLKEMGHKVNVTEDYQIYLGGVQLIYYDVNTNSYIGVSDPRRAGTALGLD